MPSVLDPPWPQLRQLAMALEPSGVVWRLGGSALQAALGLTDEVGDLDVTVPADAMDPVIDALGGLVAAPGSGSTSSPALASAPAVTPSPTPATAPTFGLRLAPAPAPAPWCSDWLARGNLDGVDIDVIGGFCVRSGRRRVAVPLDLGGHLDVEGVTIPLADPAVWWWVYATYKPAAAERLASVIDAPRRAAVVDRLGPPEPMEGHR